MAGQCLDGKDRQRLDEDLYAPPGGWEAADERLRAAIAAAPDPEGG
jgi:hypothetical protein